MSLVRLPASADSHVHDVPSDEEFLSRFGDVIDDRIAETLDELLELRNAAPRRRWPRLAGLIGLVAAAAAIALLWRRSSLTWIIWPATTIACIAIAWPRGRDHRAATRHVSRR